MKELRGSPDCLIGKGMVAEGSLSSEGVMRIEGRCSGRITCAATVVVVEGARVDAKIHAENVIVAGLVHGSITARKLVRLCPSARVRGDVKAGEFLMEAGARLWGRVDRYGIIAQGESN